MILLKIAGTLVLTLFILLLPAVIVNSAADKVVNRAMSWGEAFRYTFRNLDPFYTFMSLVMMLIGAGCIQLLWS